MEERIRAGLAALGLAEHAGAAENLARYGRMLIEKNQVMNLTAITEPDQVADLHFLDCAALLTLPGVDLKGKSLVDVGTGAGFPGLPLRILEPTLRVTLLDSLGKRVDWLGEVCAALGMDDVRRVHARAEEQALESCWRDSFDLVTSRAVADLRLLCEICLPYVKPGGHFLAMKSVDCDGELSAAEKGITLLGGRVERLYDYDIPGAGVRHRVVCVEKIFATPKGYPRRWAKIQKSPL